MATELISGVKAFNASLQTIEKRMRMAGRQIVVEGGQVIAKNSREMFTSVVENKQGVQGVIDRSYGQKGQTKMKLVRKGAHVGPEGGPPNTRTGYLQRSIQTSRPEEIGTGRWTTSTGPKAIYGRRIELGFPRGNYAYPYLQPGFEKSMPEIKVISERVWAGVLRG